MYTMKLFHFFFLRDSDGFGVSGREKADEIKDSDVAWIIFQTMTIKATYVEGFLFYIAFFTATNIL